MQVSSRTVFVLVAALGLSPVADAALIQLKSGTFLEGDFISGTDQLVTFHVYGEDDSRTIPRDDLTPGSWYAARSSTAGKDAQAHLALGEWCVQNRLYTQARTEYSKAVFLDSSLREAVDKDLAALHEAQASAILTTAQHAFAEGHHALAEQTTSRVLTLFKDTDSYQAANDLHDKITATMAEDQKTREANAAKPSSEIYDGQFNSIDKLIASGDRRNQEGLKGQNQTQQINSFKIGIRDYRHAIARLDNILKSATRNPEVMAHANKTRAEAVDDAVQCYLNLAHLYASRTSYPDAINTIKEAQRLAPDDERLTSYQKEVEMLSASNAGWGRRLRR